MNDIHNYIVDFLTSDTAAPLDILENAEITDKKCICAPAYYYHYNGTSDYMCDIGQDTQRQIQGSDGKYKTVIDTSWSTISGNTRAEAERIVSGNKDYDFVVDEIYTPYTSGILTDAESLEIPFDAVTPKYTRPSSELLEKYVRSNIEQSLMASVAHQLGGRKYPNLTLGKSNIERDSTVDKVLVSLYQIVVSYGGANHNIYFTGNGSAVLNNNAAPCDPARAEETKNLNDTLKSVEGSLSLTTGGIVAGIILGLILISTVIVPILCIGLIGFCIKKKIELKAKKEDIQNKINNFGSLVTNAKTKFQSEGCKLKGTEEHLFK